MPVAEPAKVEPTKVDGTSGNGTSDKGDKGNEYGSDFDSCSNKCDVEVAR